MSAPEKNEAGTYEAVLKRMLNSLAHVSMTTRDKILHPLAGFNRNARHDFTMSLLSGWAAIADIIRFYRDRITDEGYLKSAMEDRSVAWLGQLLGYRKWQGEAATTWLALTVSSTSLPQESAASGIVQIPAGGNLVVQNIPSSGAQPVIFESHDAVEARTEWNRLLPFTTTSSQTSTIFDGMAGMRFSGQVSSLRPGSPILIQTPDQSFFRVVDQVQPASSAQFTVITWTEPLKVDSATSNQILAVSTFRQHAGFLGRKAPAWKTAPDSVRQKTGTRSGGILSRTMNASAWTSMQSNLPSQLIQALAVGPNGQIFAGTSNGLYTTAHPGSEWSAVSTSPGQQNVQSVFINEFGYLYVGGTRGSVSFSTDAGQSWQSLRGPVYLGSGRLDGAHGLRYWIKRLLHIPASSSPKPASTPPLQANLDGVIRGLAEFSYDKSRFLFAGTDRGIFFLQSGGLDWTTCNEGLLGYNPTTGMCSAVILTLFATAESPAHSIYAGTEFGIYRRSINEKNWRLIKLPDLAIQPKIFAFAEYDRRIFAGTSQGLFATEGHNNWRKVTGRGLPENASFRALASCRQPHSTVLLAGTDQGAFVSSDDGATWTPLACQNLTAFCLNTSFADSLDRSDLSSSLRAIFSANEIDLPADAKVEPTTQGVAWEIYSPSQIEASCFGFSLLKETSSIHVHRKIPLSNPDVRAVASLPSGEFLITSPIGDFLESEWPGFHLCSATVALDRIISGLQPDSPIVIHQDQPAPATVLANIENVEQRPVQAWGRQATVSVLALQNLSGHMELLRQRDAVIYCKPNSLTAYALEEAAVTPISGESVTVFGSLAGLREDMPIAITGQPPTALLSSVGGIFLCMPSDPSNSTVRQPAFTPFGLKQENIQALAAGGGFYWAAAENAGIYFRRDIGFEDGNHQSEWMPLTAAGAPVSVQCLFWSNDSLWAGTSADHLYQCTQKQSAEEPCADESATTIEQWVWTQDTSAPAGILSFIADDAGVLYAGTPSQGVFRKTAESKNWIEIPSTIPLTDVLSFAIGPDKNFYAGAAQGVFHLDASGTFVPITSSSESQEKDDQIRSVTDTGGCIDHVTALAFERDTLYAGTAAGEVFSLPPQSSIWTSVSAHRLKSKISAIAFSTRGIVIVGTRGEGVCQLSRGDGFWTTIAYVASNDIVALIALPTGSLLAATSNASILSNGDAELKSAQRNPLFVAPTSFASLLDIQFATPDLVAMFQRYLTGFTDPSVSTLQRGQSWMIRSGALSFLLHMRNHGLPNAQIVVDQLDTFFAMSCETDSALRYTLWKLSNGTQSAWIKLSLEEPDIFLSRALPGSPSLGEVAQISSMTLSDTTEATQINLKTHLSNLYDPNVTVLNANLAYATQGITVPLEILGSGNAAVAHQSFRLKRPPVTYARTQPQNEVTCSLQIHVNSSSSPNAPPPSAVNATPTAPRPNGELWRQVPSFFNVEPVANVYTLTRDTEGNDTVQFGDGLQGSRLPTGVDNVAASYRTGLGTQGNIDSGSLIVFRKRPLGIRSVTNPVPAKNGSNPEDTATSRRRMKTWACALDRIVSLRDYADFCLARPDILKAQVTQLEEESGADRIHITIATIDRLPIDPSSEQGNVLQREIANASARDYSFSLGGFTTLHFQLKAKVMIDASDDQESIRQNIIDALCDTFSFDNRSFAQGVTATEITATIQRVHRVQGVSLEALYLKGELPGNFAELVSQPARWNRHHKIILPAQLLLFDLAPDAADLEFVESA